MKAWVLRGVGNIQMETVEEPEPAEREVLVAVKAVGICGSDLPRIDGMGTCSYPLIPGHEFSGVVEAIGRGADARWLHKRVGIFPLIPCGGCIPCRRGQYEMCRHYSYLGSRRDGGFGEYVAVPQANLIELPDTVSFEEAAMLEPMAVAVHAMKRAAPAAGENVAVCGLGTIGLLLAMFLKEAGICHIFAIGNKDAQERAARTMGLPEECYCDSRSHDVARWLLEQTKGAGADVFFECVGKNETVAQALEMAAPGGRICLVGNPCSDMLLEKSIYWKILRSQLTVTGTWNSSFTHREEDDWHYALDRIEQGRIAPARLITHRYPLEGLGRGFQLIRDKTEDYIKIMAVPDRF